MQAFHYQLFLPLKRIHRHTWYSPTGFTKRVDYILAEWHLNNISSNCRVYRKVTVPFETNHRLLAMTCSFPSKRNSVVTDINKSCNDLNSDLSLIKDWALQWKMSFNPDPNKQAAEVTFSRKKNPLG